MNKKVLYIVLYSANISFIKLLPILNSYLFTNQKNVSISHIFNQKLFSWFFFKRKIIIYQIQQWIWIIAIQLSIG